MNEQHMTRLEKIALISAASGAVFNVFLYGIGATLRDAGADSQLFYVRVVAAILQAAAFDLVAIATVMGRQHGRWSNWSRVTAFVAAGVSVMIALDVAGVWPQPWLHAANALIVLSFMMHLLSPQPVAPSPQPKVQPDWFEVQLAPPSVALPQLTVVANATEDDTVALSVAPELHQMKRNPLDGVDVAAQLAAQFGGNKTAMANHYGVSAQAIRNRLREAN